MRIALASFVAMSVGLVIGCQAQPYQSQYQRDNVFSNKQVTQCAGIGMMSGKDLGEAMAECMAQMGGQNAYYAHQQNKIAKELAEETRRVNEQLFFMRADQNQVRYGQ